MSDNLHKKTYLNSEGQGVTMYNLPAVDPGVSGGLVRCQTDPVAHTYGTASSLGSTAGPSKLIGVTVAVDGGGMGGVMTDVDTAAPGNYYAITILADGVAIITDLYFTIAEVDASGGAGNASLKMTNKEILLPIPINLGDGVLLEAQIADGAGAVSNLLVGALLANY